MVVEKDIIILLYQITQNDRKHNGYHIWNPNNWFGKIIYGAGNGLALSTTAGLTGNTTINMNATINKSVYGGGNSANVIGNTNVNLSASNNLAIHGGGNGTGKVSLKSSVNINNGTYGTIYGGGQIM